MMDQLNHEFIVRADLHCHTRASFDGFTTSKELLKACIIKNINAVAITEHDLINRINKIDFINHGIYIIDGCEYTTNKGAHIIGLFVNSLIANGSSDEVIEHIKSQDGLVLIPHPFKPGSGVCAIYEDPSSILEKSDLIELFNGGYKINELEKKNIYNLSNTFKLKLVANSDSHKINQFGYYSTVFKTGNYKDIKSIIKNCDSELYIDSLILSSPRSVSKYQLSPLYQFLIRNSPIKFRRFLKILQYIFRKRVISRPRYTKIN